MKFCLFFASLLVIITSVQAMAPPGWVQQGTRVTYEASLSPYYDLVDTPDNTWQKYGGTGVYGYWIDEISSASGDGNYEGLSTIYDYFSGNILVQVPWAYVPGNDGMGLFWVDPDQGLYTQQFLVAEAPLELAGTVWNAQTYYFTSLGSSFDTKITIDKDSGLLLSKNEGLTGSNGQMQRAVYILKSIT